MCKCVVCGSEEQDHFHVVRTWPVGEFVLPVIDGAVADVIVMNPGVPKLGIPEFDEWLKDWNEVHNPGRC